MKNRDIVMFGPQPWDMDIGGNFKDIARVIANQNRVLYVNRPLDSYTRAKYRSEEKIIKRVNVIKGIEPPITEVQRNLWVFNPRKILTSINFLPKGFLYNYLNKRNNRLIAEEIKYAMKQLGFKNEILIIDTEFFNALYLKEYLNPRIFIYYLRDYLRFHKYFKKHGDSSEPAILQKADAVITDSLYLDEYAKKYNHNSFFVHKGCDEAFRRLDHAEPEDLKNIPAPRIGYLGAISSSRLDLSLLESLALRLPDYNFVFVGPEDENFKKSRLQNLPNVYFLGFKEQHEAPAYIQHFDVCTNMQLINETTIGNHPRKIIEYLSAGKPVVATRTEAMKEYEKIVFLCESEDDFLAAIREAYSERNDTEKRNARLKKGNEYSWPATVNKFYDVIQSVYDKDRK